MLLLETPTSPVSTALVRNQVRRIAKQARARGNEREMERE